MCPAEALQGGEVWPCTEAALRGSSRGFEASNCGQDLGSFWSRERSALQALVLKCFKNLGNSHRQPEPEEQT